MWAQSGKTSSSAFPTSQPGPTSLRAWRCPQSQSRVASPGPETVAGSRNARWLEAHVTVFGEMVEGPVWGCPSRLSRQVGRVTVLSPYWRVQAHTPGAPWAAHPEQMSPKI